MRNAIISAMVLSATLLPTVSVLGQDDASKITDSLRQKLKKECIGSATVTKEAPYKTGDYIPTGASYLNATVRNFYDNMDYDSGFDTSCQKGEIKPDFDYYYMISKGVTGNPNEVGVVYYIYFNKSQCQILKWDTVNNKLISKSAVFNCENIGLNTRFSEGRYNFMGNLITPVVNSKYTNNTRHNELLQSMVDVNTMDYNGDGIDDLFLVFGRTLRIYDGKDMRQLLSYAMRNERDNISPSSVVYDFNGDGKKDYLCMYIHMLDPGRNTHYEIDENNNNVDIDGLFIYSKRDNDGKFTYSDPVKKNVNDRTDFFEKHKKMSTIHGIRTTLNMQLVYPDGKNSAPKLALAVNAIHRPSGANYIFDQQLTIIDVIPNMEDNAKDWYKVSGYITRESKAMYWYTYYEYTTQIFNYNRNVPYLFGKPALCAASVEGNDNPQKIFWVDGVYSYNSSSRTFVKDFEIQGKHKEDEGSGFDRVVGGQVVAVPSHDLTTEEFAFVLADSESEYWNDYREWKDISFKLATVSKKTGQWDISVIKDYVLDNSIKVKDNEGKEITSKLDFSLTNVGRDRGMKVRLEKAEVTITTPIIDHVICAAPIQGDTPASISFDHSESHTVSRSISASSNYGYSLDTGVGFFKTLKFTIGSSVNNTMSNSQSEATTETVGHGLSINNANDYVLFNCYVADKYDYVIDECESTPELVGTKFSVMRLRESFCRQFDKKVDEFNLLVRGTSCPEITEDVLCHKTGDYKTYPHNSNSGALDVEKIFGLKDASAYIMTGFVTRSSNNTVLMSASFNKSKSETKEESQSVSTKASISLDLGFAGVGYSTTFTWSGGASQGWSETMSLGSGTSVAASLPKSTDDKNAYCMVYYKKDITTKEGAPYSFMVVNWCYAETNNINAKMRAMNLDYDETSGINSIDKKGAEVTSVVYFDANGSEHIAPTKGLNIKVTTYADGTKSTVKMMNK